jgi:hypothetical protein
MKGIGIYQGTSQETSTSQQTVTSQQTTPASFNKYYIPQSENTPGTAVPVETIYAEQVTIHNELTERDALNVHPGTSITVDYCSKISKYT